MNSVWDYKLSFAELEFMAYSNITQCCRPSIPVLDPPAPVPRSMALPCNDRQSIRDKFHLFLFEFEKLLILSKECINHFAFCEPTGMIFKCKPSPALMVYTDEN